MIIITKKSRKKKGEKNKKWIIIHIRLLATKNHSHQL